MASTSFSLDFDVRVTCLKCGIERDWPENDRPMPVLTDGQPLTVFADSPCGCGAKRVKVEAVIDACREAGS